MGTLVSGDGRSDCCPYCTGFLGASGNAREPWDEVLSIRDDVYLVPTRGCLVEGWLLAIPREHTLSLAHLAPHRQTAAIATARHAADRVSLLYGTATVFEHGASVPRSAVGCGVDHAHLHIVPLPFSLGDVARHHPLGRTLTWRRAEGWEGIEPSAGAYLAVTSGDGVLVGSGDIPSQFFRRVIADELGCGSRFDWKADDGLENVVRTVARYRAPQRRPVLAAV